MYIKMHHSQDRCVVAVCDKELIGKTLKDGNVNLVVSERFYKGDEESEEKIISILKDADNINLMGKKAVDAGLKARVIEKDNIKIIKGVPHAQAVTF